MTTASSRYWRIQATDASWSSVLGGYLSQIYSVSLYASTDLTGTDLALAGTATASSVYSGYPASNAIDGNATSPWVSAINLTTPAWLQIVLPTAKVVRSVALSYFAQNAGYVPKSLVLQYSTDNGTTWLNAVSVTTDASAATASTYNKTITNIPLVSTRDQYFNNVVALLHMDGINNGTTFTDVKGHAFTRGGTPVISTAQSKFGGSSTLFSATSDYVISPSSADYIMGTGDFTIEFWMYATATDSKYITDFGTNGGTVIYTASKIEWYTPSCTLFSTTSVPLNTWTHVAVERANNVVHIFINGVSDATAADTFNITSTYLTIGNYGAGGYAFSGYLDEVRVTKGVARYSSNTTFAVPLEEYPSVANPGFTYPAWDPSFKSVGTTLTNNNLTSASTDGSAYAVRATLGKTSGKWYWEVRPSTVWLSWDIVGVVDAESLVGAGFYENMHGYISNNGNKLYKNWSGTAYGSVWSGTSNVIGVALDMDAGTITFYKDGVSQGVAFTGLTGTQYPALGCGSGAATSIANFGETAFAYAVPAGYSPGIYQTVRNYATWSPTDKNSSITLSQGNLIATQAASAYNSLRANMSIPDGAKVYFEVKANNALQQAIGVTLGSETNNSYFTANSIVWYCDGTCYTGAGSYVTIATYTTNDIIGVVVDRVANLVDLYKNNVFVRQVALPAGLQLLDLFPCLSQYNYSSATANFGASTFAYAVPSGAAAGLYEGELINNTISVPGAPTTVVATATGATQASVAFNAPAVDGGSAITSYTVTSSPGNITASGLESPITITGLTTGTAYTFTVAATNSAGIGTASAASSSITTWTVAGAPTSVVVSNSGATSQSVAFTAPVSNGGTEIISYTAVTSNTSVTDPSYSNVVLHMHMDGENGSTVFVDEKAHTVTRYGNAVISTSNFKFGSASMLLDGIDDYIIAGTASADFTLGTGNFTIEGWINTTQSDAYINLFNDNSDFSLGNNFILMVSNGNAFRFYNANTILLSGTRTINDGVWHHYAVVRNGTGLALYIDGTLVQATVITESLAFGNGNGIIFGMQPGWERYYSGYMDELRVTKGVARYTADFTPATEAFPGLSSVTHTATGTSSPILITDLTTGLSYNYTVYATNAVGAGPQSSVSNTLKVGIPEAPTSVVATAQDSTNASITFDAALANGSNITGYTVTSSPDNIAASGADTTIIVEGLTPRTAYTFTVVANSDRGDGLTSVASNSITMYGAPDAPLNVVGTRGYRQIEVDFTEAANDGGSQVTSFALDVYNYVATNDTNTVVLLHMDGANNSTTFTEEHGIAVTPYGAPKLITADKQFGTACASFSGAASNYLSLPSGSVSLGGGDFTVECWIKPLSDDGPYLYLLEQANNTGLSGGLFIYRNQSTKLLVVGIPAADGIQSSSAVLINQWYHVAIVRAGNACTLYINGVASGSGTASVSVAEGTFLIGAYHTTTSYNWNGYIDELRVSKVARYTGAFTVPSAPFVASSTSTTFIKTVTENTHPIIVDSLIDNGTYYFQAKSINQYGSSAASTASANVTTFAVPGVPTGVTAVVNGDDQMSISFTAPVDTGGTPITGYTVTSNTGGFTATGTSSPLIISGLNSTTSYTYTVVATNLVGNSAASTPSTAVTALGVSEAPTAVVGASTGPHSMQITFTAPSDIGGTEITNYTAYADQGGLQFSATTSPITATGLDLGIGYSFTVRATNAIGTGPASIASAPSYTSPTTTYTQIGDNSFKLSVVANTPVADVMWAIANGLYQHGDWAWYDNTSHVFRALNLDGSYKYCRINVSGTAGNAMAITEAYETWNATSHTGVNRAGPPTSGQAYDDYLKTAFWISKSTAFTIYVYVSPRWLLIGSDVGSSTGMGINGVVNDRPWSPADYRSETSGYSAVYDPVQGNYPVSASASYNHTYCDTHQLTDYKGMSGVIEIYRGDDVTQNATVPPYFWTHTGWWIDDNSAKPQTYDTNTESNLLSYWNTAFEGRTANCIGFMPRNTSGQLGTAAGIQATSEFMVDTQNCYLRSVTSTIPVNLFNSKNPVWDIGCKQMNGTFLGMVMGIKPSRPTGSSPAITAVKPAVLDSNFFIVKAGYGNESNLLPIPSCVAKTRSQSSRSTSSTTNGVVYSTNSVSANMSTSGSRQYAYRTNDGYYANLYAYYCRFAYSPSNANIRGTWHNYGYRSNDPWGFGWSGWGYYAIFYGCTSVNYNRTYSTYGYNWPTDTNSWDFKAIFYIPQ